MVKKNLVNKNVIRALSIGLSVAMMSQPLTAMAANEEVNPIDDPNTAEHEYEDKQVADAAQEKAADAWNLTKDGEAKADTAVQDETELSAAMKDGGLDTTALDESAKALEESLDDEAPENDIKDTGNHKFNSWEF